MPLSNTVHEAHICLHGWLALSTAFQSGVFGMIHVLLLQFKENEEKFEKKVQEQLGGAADAITDTASNAAGKVKEVLPNVKGKHQKHPCC